MRGQFMEEAQQNPYAQQNSYAQGMPFGMQGQGMPPQGPPGMQGQGMPPGMPPQGQSQGIIPQQLSPQQIEAQRGMSLEQLKQIAEMQAQQQAQQAAQQAAQQQSQQQSQQAPIAVRRGGYIVNR
jgi:hypothetical protein